VLGRPRQIDYKAEGTTNANYGKPLDLYPVDTGRLRRVVEVVAERSGWANKPSEKGHAFGFAAHRSFLSYVAAVVEVEIDHQGQVRIPRVDLAVDAGRVVHPECVQAQFEGAAVFATSLALMGEITAAKGHILSASSTHAGYVAPSCGAGITPEASQWTWPYWPWVRPRVRLAPALASLGGWRALPQPWREESFQAAQIALKSHMGRCSGAVQQRFAAAPRPKNFYC
jgi:hypothetical protein